MVLARGAVGLVLLAIWIFCIIDAITTPAEQIRNLPKAVWVIIVIVLVDIGSIAWLVAGRNWSGSPNQIGRQPQRPAKPTNPDDDEEFQRFLRKRAEDQRRRAREANPPPDGEPPPVT